jgi:hypothetical protein
MPAPTADTFTLVDPTLDRVLLTDRTRTPWASLARAK